MRPDTIKRLRDSPDFQELLVFLQTQVARLNQLSALKNAAIDDYYTLVVGRLHAKEIIDDILGELTRDINTPSGMNPKDYVVE
jgi:hypothetical protein